MKLRNHLFEASRIPPAASKKHCAPPTLRRGEHVSLLNSFFRWTAPALAVIVAGLLSGVALAQVPPTLIMSDASVFEGNAGTRTLAFQVTLTNPVSNPSGVTALLSAVALSGTGGAACTGGVDFIQLNNVAFAIPANVTTATIDITVCGNTTIEADESIFVSLTSVAGALCFEGTCNAVGTILNDDGPPSMSINNISTSEPVTGLKTTAFTVSLHHPSTQTTSVHFATRNGTAKVACSFPCTPFAVADYFANSGTLTIPPNTLSGIINVIILGDGIRENDETFFVDLSAAINATIADSVGQATIRDTTLTFTGGFDLSPDNAVVQVGETVIYTVDWTVPEGRVWRDLTSIDFRIRDGHKTALWIRWDEASNTFSLCRKSGKAGKGDDDDDDNGDDDRADHGREPGAVCAPGEPPGSVAVLETPFTRVHLVDSDVVGSGPTGRVVTLELALSFLRKAAGHSFTVELAAADDFGNEDRFVRASELRVEKSRH